MKSDDNGVCHTDDDLAVCVNVRVWVVCGCGGEVYSEFLTGIH